MGRLRHLTTDSDVCLYVGHNGGHNGQWRPLVLIGSTNKVITNRHNTGQQVEVGVDEMIS